jgi:hypothetical protein
VRTVRIAFRDFWAGFEPAHFFRRHPGFTRDFHFELSPRPDLLIHSCFPRQVKVDEVPRIDDAATRLFYTAENTPTDLSRSDFALGFDRDVDCERYLRLPNYVATQAYFGFAPDALVGRTRRDLAPILARPRGFCAFVQGHSVPWRDAFVRQLSARQRVDCGGPVLNNVGYTVGREAKYEFLRRYRFAICFENQRARGYVTEKLNDALLCDAVPIYCGDPSVALDFAPGSYLDLADFESPAALIERVLEIDRDPAAYRDLLAAAAYPGDGPSPWLDPERERAFVDRVCSAALAARRWFWIGSAPDGGAQGAPLSLGLGPLAARRPGEVQVSSDPLDQPDLCDDEASLSGLADGSVRELRAPALLLQWDPPEALAALRTWRAKLAPQGRLELAVADWDHARRLASSDPQRAFAALFAHGSRRAPRWGWMARELSELLAAAGFEALDLRPFGPELRARAADSAAALADPLDQPPDLVCGWPRFEDAELRSLLQLFLAAPTPELRLALRHDPHLDGPLAAALACVRRAAHGLPGAEGREVAILSEPWGELCPFILGARSAAVFLSHPEDPDRRRFAAALCPAPLSLAELAAELHGRRRAG